MTKLRLLTAVMSAWLFVLYNIERIHQPIDLASFVYPFAAVVTVSLVCVSRLSAWSPTGTGAVLACLFLALKFWLGYPIAGFSLPLTVTELCAILVTFGLARQLARSLGELEEATNDAAMIDLDSRLSPFEVGQTEIYREVRRARQYVRPLTLLTISPTADSVCQSVNRYLEEIHRKTVGKYVHARVADQLSKEISPCDLIARRNGHFVVLLPETDRAAADGVVRRLKHSVAEELGLEVRVGAATLPDDEVTLTGLLERAEAEMQGRKLQLVTGA